MRSRYQKYYALNLNEKFNNIINNKFFINIKNKNESENKNNVIFHFIKRFKAFNNVFINSNDDKNIFKIFNIFEDFIFSEEEIFN